MKFGPFFVFLCVRNIKVGKKYFKKFIFLQLSFPEVLLSSNQHFPKNCILFFFSDCIFFTNLVLKSFHLLFIEHYMLRVI